MLMNLGVRGLQSGSGLLSMLPYTARCSHRMKRMRQIKKMAQRGLLDPEKEDPLALFVASTTIRYCYYHETQNILGNTYGMAVLQVGATLGDHVFGRIYHGVVCIITKGGRPRGAGFLFWG